MTNNLHAPEALKKKRSELLARVYTLILSPEWEEEKKPPKVLKRHTRSNNSQS